MNVSKSFLAIISATLITTIPISSQTLNEQSATALPTSASIISSISHNDRMTPNDTQIALTRSSITRSGGNFVVPANYGWLKVWVYNTGNSELTVTVRKANRTTNYLYYKIPPKKQMVIPNNGKATGTGLHIINFSSANGVLSGDFSVVMADNPKKSQS
ncbi:hypothetical protein L2089_22670 [Paenibacillus hunanensis]|uniref:hypothetical protein n=1 Tax=Paenibacillus hunanensis TaxID=539262 RepID=UPI00202661FD|nr:hypothetical protein [Paenibacillus hunanensis]MCL9663483.1 hypothetical protein [Paenibacillus hunanensis]